MSAPVPTATATAELDIDVVTRTVTELFEDAGAPRTSARLVAESLVTAERMGHASHGLVRVLEYRDAVRSGRILPAAVPEVVQRDGSTAVVDGRWGWGHVAARLAADTASDIADRTGVAVVSVRHCNHSGRLGEWVEVIADHGHIGIGLLSCGPAVAPLGGLDRVLGTNPLAIAIPTADRAVVLDLATAGLAEGKVRVAARSGASVPAGVLQDSEGRPTTDPAAFYAGGSILPFGGHKGHALSIAIQLLGDSLTGSQPGGPEFDHTNGLVLMAVRPGALVPPDEFTAVVEADRRRVLGSRAVTPGRPVLLPGDVEAQTSAGQPPGQVAVARTLWGELQELHDEARRPV